ncbi:MAG: urease accessory protein UreF [Coleofasciculus sp. B1-GNL1-01]|uniref:urease accessory protein UreF n=1 Tax=Coleofasciculus sp. B1-GNL1-01 TaxID=3068484 RepID=UPI0033037B92
MTNDQSYLLRLLQLASPGLPVGAYSYSEGLEILVEKGIINNPQQLKAWIDQELSYGAIRLEAAIMVRAYQSLQADDLEALSYWNAWASAAKETSELRSQSWQMGNSLIRLLVELEPELQSVAGRVGTPCNYAIAFGTVAAYWQINLMDALLGYLHSWASNLINTGVKLIPLGQTAGQQLLLELAPQLSLASQEVLTLDDEQLHSCSWGLALSSMAHEIQYTRLFRS